MSIYIKRAELNHTHDYITNQLLNYGNIHSIQFIHKTDLFNKTLLFHTLTALHPFIFTSPIL